MDLAIAHKKWWLLDAICAQQGHEFAQWAGIMALKSILPAAATMMSAALEARTLAVSVQTANPASESAVASAFERGRGGSKSTRI